MKESHIPFDILDVKEPLRDEVYVATFLSCWICRFLLQNKEVNYIHPSVFKVTTLMASEEILSLAIPVLATIYNGLRKVVHAPNLKECSAVFSIHYIYGWIG